MKLYKYLCEDKKEFVLSKQLLRSGTAIGANIEEAIGGQSEKDFLPNYLLHIKKREKRIIGLDCLLILITLQKNKVKVF